MILWGCFDGERKNPDYGQKMAAAGAAALILFAGGAFGSYFATHQAVSMSNSHNLLFCRS